MYATGRLLWLSLSVLILSLSACDIPGGASVPALDDERYHVQVPFKEIDFNIAAPKQDLGGVTASVVTDDSRPTLYYSYSVTSQVNGNYVAMPYPPMTYTIRKIPFYKADSDTVTVHIDLQNATDKVVRASQATCSFDVDGKTVASVPLNATDLLPGHDLTIQVQGPALDQFGANASGTMTVWLYGLTDDRNQALHWQVNYIVKQENRQIWGSVEGQTSSKDEADHYKGLVEAAGADALVNPPPGG